MHAISWGSISVEGGTWHIHFAGRSLLVPLNDSLYWSIALQILGHDAPIKETYQALITSDQRPILFIDVGANYGTHTILFLLHEIPVLAFEPNSECFSKFKSICDLNSLQGDWEMVALGNYVGEIELLYPEQQTWMGSTANDLKGSLGLFGAVKKQRVPVRRLDDYLPNLPLGKILIKIDAEGSELDVLRGSAELLHSRSPIIIFESFNSDDCVSRAMRPQRPELFALLRGFGYEIHPVHWRVPEALPPVLNVDEFIRDTGTNFLAVSVRDSESYR
jgi:FkbM family methyltransferase